MSGRTGEAHYARAEEHLKQAGLLARENPALIVGSSLQMICHRITAESLNEHQVGQTLSAVVELYLGAEHTEGGRSLALLEAALQLTSAMCKGHDALISHGRRARILRLLAHTGDVLARGIRRLGGSTVPQGYSGGREDPNDLSRVMQLRCDALHYLTESGRQVKQCEDVVSSLLSVWLDEMRTMEDDTTAAVEVFGQSPDVVQRVFPLWHMFLGVVEEIYHHSGVWLDVATGRAFALHAQRTVRILYHLLVSVGNPESVQKYLVKWVSVLHTIVRTRLSDKETIRAIVEVLCVTVNVDKLSKESWVAMQDLLRGQPWRIALRELLDLIETSPADFANIGGGYGGHVARGAVFCTAMASWGSQRVLQEVTAYYGILQSFLLSVQRQPENTLTEITLSLKRLISKFGSELCSSWPVVFRIMDVANTYALSAEGPLSDHDRNALASSLSTIIDHIVALHRKRELYCLDSELFSCLAKFRSWRYTAVEAALFARAAAAARPSGNDWQAMLSGLVQEYFLDHRNPWERSAPARKFACCSPSMWRDMLILLHFAGIWVIVETVIPAAPDANFSVRVAVYDVVHAAAIVCDSEKTFVSLIGFLTSEVCALAAYAISSALRDASLLPGASRGGKARGAELGLFSASQDRAEASLAQFSPVKFGEEGGDRRNAAPESAGATPESSPRASPTPGDFGARAQGAGGAHGAEGVRSVFTAKELALRGALRSLVDLCVYWIARPGSRGIVALRALASVLPVLHNDYLISCAVEFVSSAHVRAGPLVIMGPLAPVGGRSAAFSARERGLGRPCCGALSSARDASLLFSTQQRSLVPDSSPTSVGSAPHSPAVPDTVPDAEAAASDPRRHSLAEGGVELEDLSVRREESAAAVVIPNFYGESVADDSSEYDSDINRIGSGPIPQERRNPNPAVANTADGSADGAASRCLAEAAGPSGDGARATLSAADPRSRSRDSAWEERVAALGLFERSGKEAPMLPTEAEVAFPALAEPLQTLITACEVQEASSDIPLAVFPAESVFHGLLSACASAVSPSHVLTCLDGIQRLSRTVLLLSDITLSALVESFLSFVRSRGWSEQQRGVWREEQTIWVLRKMLDVLCNLIGPIGALGSRGIAENAVALLVEALEWCSCERTREVSDTSRAVANGLRAFSIAVVELPHAVERHLASVMKHLACTSSSSSERAISLVLLRCMAASSACRKFLILHERDGGHKAAPLWHEGWDVLAKWVVHGAHEAVVEGGILHQAIILWLSVCPPNERALASIRMVSALATVRAPELASMAKATLDIVLRMCTEDQAFLTECPVEPAAAAFSPSEHVIAWREANSLCSVRACAGGFAHLVIRRASGTRGFLVQLDSSPAMLQLGQTKPQAPARERGDGTKEPSGRGDSDESAPGVGDDDGAHAGEDQPNALAWARSIASATAFAQLRDLSVPPGPESPRFLRGGEELDLALRILDNTPTRSTCKLAVLYVDEGQRSESEILANERGSARYASFVSRLGSLVSLRDARGIFVGGLDRERNRDGTFAIVSENTAIQVIFHVATMMPTLRSDNVPGMSKKRHVGNDFVAVFYCEDPAFEDEDVIKSHMTTVRIFVYPLAHELFLVRVKRRAIEFLCAPLFDEHIVTAGALPALLLETATHAELECQLRLSRHGYHNAVGRMEQIMQISENFAMDVAANAESSERGSVGDALRQLVLGAAGKTIGELQD